MKPVTLFLILSSIGITSSLPLPLFAQESPSVPASGDIVALTAVAEQHVTGMIPDTVQSFIGSLFTTVETFRLEQVAYATTRRDMLAEQVLIAQDAQTQAVEDNRDAVLDGEATSLYAGAGQRLRQDVGIQAKITYYAYSFYTRFVSSPILFYVVGSLLVLYVLSFIVRRFRSRRSED